MQRLFPTLIASFILGALCHVAITLHAAETRIKRRQKSSQTVIVRKQKQQIVTKRDEVIGSVLKISHQKGKAYCWVSLRNQDDKPIERLTAGDFEVIETVNGVSRHVPAEDIILQDTPLLTVLARDMSPSMSERARRNSRRAITIYLSKMRPQDKSALIVFAATVKVMQGFTNETHLLQTALSKDFSSYGTSLHDAIKIAIEAHQTYTETVSRAIIVVLTDGTDNSSRISLDDLSALVEKSGIPIVIVGIGQADPQVLKKIASKSHGLYFYAASSSVLDSIYESIQGILHGSYMLAFASSAQSGDKVQIEVATSSSADIKRVSRFFGEHVIP